MGTRINTAAYERFNASFGKFVESKSVEDSTIAIVDNNSKFSLNGVSKLKAGTGDYKGNLFRSDKQIADNNSTRARFMSAVADIFGGKNRIPESVKTAMKWDDFDGKGRPLTARRIRATWDQIKAEQKAEQKAAGIRDALSAQDWFGGKEKVSPDTKLKLNSLINQLSTDLCQSMEKLLLPDIREGKAPSVEKWKAFLRNALVDSEKTRGILNDFTNDNDNLVKEAAALNNKEKQQAIDARNLIPVARKASMAFAMTKNVKLANFFFNTSKESKNAYLTLEQASNDLHEEFSEADGYNFNNEDDIKEIIDEFGQDKLAILKEKQEKNNALNSMCTPLVNGVTEVRGFFVFGMSQEKAVSEMIRLSNDKKGQGEIRIADVLTALRYTPSPKAKAILTDYFKQIGKQIVDGTLRKKNKTHNDQLYDGVLLEDFWHAMADCAKDNNWLMGSKEQDKELFTKLIKLLEEAGHSRPALIGRLKLDELFAE